MDTLIFKNKVTIVIVYLILLYKPLPLQKQIYDNVSIHYNLQKIICHTLILLNTNKMI